MRNIFLRTGRGGMELLSIACEEHLGYKRIYLPKKLPRIVRPKGVKKNLYGHSYFLVKIV